MKGVMGGVRDDHVELYVVKGHVEKFSYKFVIIVILDCKITLISPMVYLTCMCNYPQVALAHDPLTYLPTLSLSRSTYWPRKGTKNLFRITFLYCRVQK